MSYPERSHGAVYKHLETDEEFRTRLWREGRPVPGYVSASIYLDEYAWQTWRAQRRIVEGVAER